MVRIRNEQLRGRIEVEFGDNVIEVRSRWYGHVKKRFWRCVSDKGCGQKETRETPEKMKKGMMLKKRKAS